MKRNEYPLRCVARDGTVSVWLYDIHREINAGHLTWNIRAWPRDAVSPVGGGEWYEVGLQEIDYESVRITIVNNHLPAPYRGRGVAVALYPMLARRLGRKLLSSRTTVTDTNEWRTPRATEIWRYLVSVGEAEELVGADSFVIDGRPGHARPTAAKPAPEWPSPTNELEFESLMTEVDRRLQAASVPIVGRVIAGIGEVSKILAAELELTASKREPIPGAYEGDDLVIRIARWFDARYGERLLMNASSGRVAVLLRNDVWIMNMPVLFGQFRLIASRTIPSDDPALRVSRAGEVQSAPRPLYNVLDSLGGLPNGLRQNLSEDELRDLLFAFETGVNAYGTLGSIASTKYIREAIADHLATADHLKDGNRGHPGAARWSALQAVEKVYKAFLTMCGAVVPQIHDLSKLSERAETVGLHPADSALIDAVQCAAAVRYGEVPVALAEAIAAHHAALDLTWYVAEEIKSRQT